MMYKKAADQGFAAAQGTLGYLYVEGKGVPKDFAQATEWFRKAADQGQADSQNSLGYAYFTCQGGNRDFRQAAEWFRKAAEQGHAFAQGNLGHLFQNGQGVPLDYCEAYKWYHLAAAQNNFQAKHALKELAKINNDAKTSSGKPDSRVNVVARAFDFESHNVSIHQRDSRLSTESICRIHFRVHIDP